MALELQTGQTVRLRKPPACGSFEWRVMRLGADIGLRCLLCGRYLLLPRVELEKSLQTQLG